MFLCCSECNGFSQTKTSAAGLHLATWVSVWLCVISPSGAILVTTQSEFGDGPNTCRSNDSSSNLNSLVIDVVIGKNSVGSSGDPDPSSLTTRTTPLSLVTRRNWRSSLGPTLLLLRLVKFRNSLRFFTTRAHFLSTSLVLEWSTELRCCSLLQETLGRSLTVVVAVVEVAVVVEGISRVCLESSVKMFFLFFANVRSSVSSSEDPS